MHRFACLLVGCLGLGVIANCSGDDEASGALTFHGEGDVVPNFSADTGLVPAGSQVQVQFVLTATGKVMADAAAEQSGPSDSPSVIGKPGSGKLAVDGHFKLQGKMRVDVSGLPKYDGPITNLEGVDIKFGGDEAFDPFLLDGSASVLTNIPETKLPPIPLPGGLTGELQITITNGSSVTATFSGVCAAVANGKASYLGKTSTTGVLKLKPTIVLKVPIKGETPFDLPVIPISLPSKDSALDLGTQPVSGGGPAKSGPPGSTARQGSCSPSEIPPGEADGSTPPPDGGSEAGSVPDAGDGYASHPDTTWQGTFTQLASSDLCRQNCDNDPMCVGYQVIGSYECKLFTLFDYAAQNTHGPGVATSYVRNSTPLYEFDVEDHFDHPGNDLSYFDNTTASSCAEKCVSNPSCVGFSMVSAAAQNKGDCWIKSALSVGGYSVDLVHYCKRGTPNCNGR